MRRGRLQPAITHVVLDEVSHTFVIALQPELVVTVRWTSSAFAYSICNSLRSCPCTGDDRGDVISALGGRTGLHALQIVGERYFPSRSGFPVVFRRQSFLALAMMIVVGFLSVTSTPRRILNSRLLVYAPVLITSTMCNIMVTLCLQ